MDDFDDAGLAFLVGAVAPALARHRCDDPTDAEDIDNASDDARCVLTELPAGSTKLADGRWVVVPAHHVVDFSTGRNMDDVHWAIEHPIDCRINPRKLIDCKVHHAIDTIVRRLGLPVPVGRYRIIDLETLGPDEPVMALVTQVGTMGFERER